MTETMSETHGISGNIVMPFYIICDVSLSMSPHLSSLNQSLANLINVICSDPIAEGMVQISIIQFGSDARVVVPMSSAASISPPTLTIGGGTNYGAAFRELHRSINDDKVRLRAQGNKVYRPCAFFLTDGEPLDSDYAEVFRSLFAFDPQTGQGNQSFPYVLAYGFDQAKANVLSKVVYPDWGKNKGAYFLSANSNVKELFDAIIGAIGHTVLSSGQSAAQGQIQHVPPPPIEGAQYGQAGDFLVD